MRIWVGSVLGVMGPRRQVADFAQNQLLKMSSRLRRLGDLFKPMRPKAEKEKQKRNESDARQK